ncbi:TetR/AcrR family transcriptional regulator [Streptomyces mobaraensis]|uniref:TetR family transcriptional regulator n=1 Tax=Streptomyces mobaraensis (strain ATCC 29032 / DSM 40847 / JCM 4168 / NBRC 13819 / NCIMB 11159 / IPCR 16-22) TaxID=1223523 RepID=M3CDR2_STRM1|nr:TetR/AcrR family transcriptional regulator [Streptomyces mobaraensis]EMF02151.1 TetR family transcriptional regulator [Streptomyces mobaraensis NBRC 13819 = DSM 40847]
MRTTVPQQDGGPPPRRSDARRNRERILAAALAELTHSPAVALSTIARKAGVGQGTLYRNFPDREALILEVYRFEVQQVHDAARHLLATRPPDRALREWLDRLARYAAAKAGLADAMREATRAPATPARWGHAPITEAVELLLEANEKAGTIRPGVTPDDFLLAIAGLWHIGPRADAGERARRLFDLVTDGLRAGAPGAPAEEPRPSRPVTPPERRRSSGEPGRRRP